MRKMKRFFVAPLLLVFMIAFCVQYYAGELMGILQDDEILGLLIVIVVISIYSFGVLLRHLQYKKAGKELPTLDRKGKMIRLVILAAMLLAEGILFYVRQGQSWERPVEEAGIEFVSLADVEGAGYSQVAGSQRFANSVAFDTSFAVPLQYDMRMSGKNADGIPVTMQVCLYEAVSEELAEPMFEAIMEAKMSWNQVLMQWEIEAEVDEAYAAGYMGFQYLFMRDGERIITVYYYGEQDVSERAELFVEMLHQ